MVKDGREAWTNGPRGWVTSRGGWHVGTSISKCTRREAHVEYATRGRLVGLGLKTIGGRLSGLGLKTKAELPRQTDGTWRHHEACIKVKLMVRRRGGRQMKKL